MTSPWNYSTGTTAPRARVDSAPSSRARSAPKRLNEASAPTEARELKRTRRKREPLNTSAPPNKARLQLRSQKLRDEARFKKRLGPTDLQRQRRQQRAEFLNGDRKAKPVVVTSIDVQLTGKEWHHCVTVQSRLPIRFPMRPNQAQVCGRRVS